ncbi:MAG: Transcriptional regulator of heat shock protein [candidate division WS6 bacterium GW2011_GWC1_36_11]|uniref:Transcriptional regulator of heat shock protein n=2 Tax=Candidatus Dojkabacteria TaxID=74243 RepID=A0A0G0DTX8_9BACT|nr:MAG: Transcriptional regulator of heat shock protein [candidate division WS6 bacterium GW2011_GWC1_36_11]
MDITERQKAILMAIIKEFMGDAEEVGSLSLVEKYHLGVSSATIRNEMVKLMQLGLLEQTHSSSGRLPTDQALRLYVSEMLGRNVINPLMSIEIRQGIFRDRFSKDIVIKSVLHILSKETDSVVFLILDEDIRYYGLANLLSFDEFQSIEKIRSIVNILEDEVFLKNITEKYSGSGVSLLIGGESGVGTLQDCAMAFTKIPFWGRDTGYVGILGSKRMDYSKVIPALKEVKSSLESSMSGWR